MAFRSISNTTYATRTSTVCNAPPGLADGDIMIAAMVGVRTAPSTTLTPPAGWTLVDQSRVKDSTGLTCDMYVWWKRAASEGASYTFTNTSASTQVMIAAYSNETATGSPIAVESKNYTTDPTSSGVTASVFAVTTTANNEDLIYLGHNWVNTGTLNPPTGMTERFDGFLYLADLLANPAGSFGPYFQTTGNAANQPWAALLFALTPAVVVAGVFGRGITVVSGVGYGVPVTQVSVGGYPVVESPNGVGVAVIKVASGGRPVTYVTPS